MICHRLGRPVENNDLPPAEGWRSVRGGDAAGAGPQNAADDGGGGGGVEVTARQWQRGRGGSRGRGKALGRAARREQRQLKRLRAGQRQGGEADLYGT